LNEVYRWCFGEQGEIRASHISKARCPDFLYAALERTACAPFFKERRMKFREPTKLHRKSGMWATP
jgi:hypothetical protein